MTNLLEETRSAIHKYGYKKEDVAFVSDGKQYCSWKIFADQSRDFSYDSGFGSQEVNENLVVVFTDGSWLDRREYDGAEWWKLNRKPEKPPVNGLVWLKWSWRYGDE